MASGYRDKFGNLSSSSDSDSENDCDVWKRDKKPPPEINTACIEQQNNDISATVPKKRKPNNIWTEVVMENDMTENICNVGLEEMPEDAMDRSSESYDFTRKRLDTRPHYDEVFMDSEDMSSNNQNGFSGTVNKFTKLNKDDAKVAKRICWKLNEPKKYLIYRVVDVIGATKALQVLKETEEVEDNGGMLVKNSTRRRTPGGVYLTILKTHITEEQRDKIFEGEPPPNFFKQKKALMKAFGIKVKKNHSRFKKHKKFGKLAKVALEEMDMDASEAKSNNPNEKHVSFSEEVKISSSPTESEQAYYCSGNSESSGVENSTSNESAKSGSPSEESDVEDGEILD